MRSPGVRRVTFLPCARCIYDLQLLGSYGFESFGPLAQLRSPRIHFVFLGPEFCLGLPSHPTSRQRSCLQLGIPTTKAPRGLSPLSHFLVRFRLPVDSAGLGAARHARRTKKKGSSGELVGRKHVQATENLWTASLPPLSALAGPSAPATATCPQVFHCLRVFRLRGFRSKARKKVHLDS